MLAEKAKARFSKSKPLQGKKDLNYPSAPLTPATFLRSVPSATPALCWHMRALCFAHGTKCLPAEQTLWEYLLQFAPCLEPCR